MTLEEFHRQLGVLERGYGFRNMLQMPMRTEYHSAEGVKKIDLNTVVINHGDDGFSIVVSDKLK